MESDTATNVKALQASLVKLRDFAMDEGGQCIHGLLQSASSSILMVHFLSCLEIKDDSVRECIVDIVRYLFDVNDPRFTAFTNR